jgi:prephenate dehydrogenase
VIERLVIVGVGLLGGSAALAARAAGLARRIVGVGRDRARLGPPVAAGALDEATTDLPAGVAGADLVLVAVPVLASEEILARIWAAAPAGTVVTDVGSTKAGIVRRAEALRPAGRLHFVGSHPMAGSERSGFSAARADLFQGARVVVTPGETSEPRAVKTVTGFWEALGARVSLLDAEAHDRAVAAVSHLPHVVAYALMDAVARLEADALDLAARGFRDTTRIAASDPDVWTEIFVANRAALGQCLRGFRQALDELEALAARDPAALRAALARIRGAREALR